MAKLTTAARAALPKKVFGLPEKAPGSGSYPIEDAGHARAALRLAHNASPANQKRIKAKVHRMYPGMGAPSGAGKMHSLSSMAA